MYQTKILVSLSA